MAVPCNLTGFAEAAGLPADAYGPDMHDFLSDDFLRDFWTNFRRSFWTIKEPIRLLRELWQPCLTHWADMSRTLASLTAGADVLFSGLVYQELAASIAEAYDIPFATLHYFPIRPNGQLYPIVPAPLVRTGLTVYDWLCWRMSKNAEDAQRRELGLPKATSPSPRRIERTALEIQAYDEACFPGLADEWQKWGDRRPFVGALTMGLTTDADEEVASWIAAGTPPICFGFGSMPVAASPADTLKMIGAACAELGERALVCAGWADFSDVPDFEHVKVVSAVNYAATFPACRAVVHHGGSGTTAASMRAGVPTLILSMDVNQTLWGARVKRLGVGTTRRFSKTTRQSLVKDLRRILEPEYAARARELATRMTAPAESVQKAADLVESFARSRQPA
ncbi:glycosyl transferase family 1 [Mycobacterium scrofulaceum]|uniref:Glycosyl transferase family 1 n=2 Tax=Mycobacterium scrofulaceum TaxID=1783 RepID=A0A1A2UDI3_MYCSC|nr:glycosyl transferase family 1 [Mycobacterium scrofulaceum]